MGVSFGANGPKFTGPHIDSQTRSIFSATRSVVFAGDRIVIASMTGMRKVEGAKVMADMYQVMSLDAQTGVIKDSREFTAFGSLKLFATTDAHVIVSGRTLVRLTPALKEESSVDFSATGHKSSDIQNASPDGSTLGNATTPGYELVDTITLKTTLLTADPAYATSVSDKGYVTDNVHWTRDYPKELGFVTYMDSSGEHLLYHGSCGGRPQFLSNDLVLEPGCKKPIIIDTHGNLVQTLDVKDGFSYAGVSQNRKRFALQVTKSSRDGSPETEKFVIYSTDTWKRLAEVTPDQVAEGQTWTAFSPDGSMFVIGSPLKLTLYRLP